MRIVEDYPPNWDELTRAFNVAGKKVICAWGGIIYNPNGAEVTPALFAHEAVHGERQAGDIVGWWRRYMDDAAFRLAEEIPAHQAEYRAAIAEARNRNERRFHEKEIAARLAGPVYGRMIKLPDARRLIKQTANEGARA